MSSAHVCHLHPPCFEAVTDCQPIANSLDTPCQSHDMLSQETMEKQHLIFSLHHSLKQAYLQSTQTLLHAQIMMIHTKNEQWKDQIMPTICHLKCKQQRASWSVSAALWAALYLFAHSDLRLKEQTAHHWHLTLHCLNKLNNNTRNNKSFRKHTCTLEKNLENF